MSNPVERLKELLPGSASNDSEEEGQFESDLRAILLAAEISSKLIWHKHTCSFHVAEPCDCGLEEARKVLEEVGL